MRSDIQKIIVVMESGVVVEIPSVYIVGFDLNFGEWGGGGGLQPLYNELRGSFEFVVPGSEVRFHQGDSHIEAVEVSAPKMLPMYGEDGD